MLRKARMELLALQFQPLLQLHLRRHGSHLPDVGTGAKVLQCRRNENGAHVVACQLHMPHILVARNNNGSHRLSLQPVGSDV